MIGKKTGFLGLSVDTKGIISSAPFSLDILRWFNSIFEAFLCYFLLKQYNIFVVLMMLLVLITIQFLVFFFNSSTDAFSKTKWNISKTTLTVIDVKGACLLNHWACCIYQFEFLLQYFLMIISNIYKFVALLSIVNCNLELTWFKIQKNFTGI